MVRLTPPSFAALAIVASQLLIAATGLWHDHGHAEPANAAACAGHLHGGEPAPAPADNPAPADDHDDCLICQIVASQRIDTIDRSGPALSVSVSIAPRAPPAPTHSSRDHIPTRSRAPPSFSHA
ncbi:MAG: hypothetical protein ACF8R7_14800 [Phycisphaerales bacterium JB039]